MTTTSEKITARPVVTRNVRVGTARRVHRVAPTEHSVILNRAAAPACGVSLGRPTARILTDDPVTCPECMRM